MGHVSEPRFRVAHGLRLKGFAQPCVVAEIAALDEPEVTNHLRHLEEQGHARHREGRITGWSLTGDGRKLHHESCADELAASGAELVVRAGYEQFLDFNPALLQACTDWQVRSDAPGGQVLNAHDDAAYDRAVIGRLAEIDAGIQPVIAALAQALDRFGAYGQRLGDALARVEAGDTEWFTGAMVESYHTVWFELHEDLLVTLGIERAAEHRGGGPA
ncbi:MAG: hypothetical protein NVS3B12_22350 [Acidimicrobiales bacterium]